jgi:tetratricopeptide (TPR) repeat protein
MVVGLVMTSSRSGGLGVLAGCLTLAAFSIRPRRIAAAAGLAGAGVMAVAIVFLTVGPLHALNDDPAALRIHLWQDGLRLLVSRPLTGWGEDTTGLVFGQFLSRDYASLVTFDRVHSGPLDTGAMLGVLGLAAIGSVLVVLFITAWRHRLEGNAAALAGALVGYTVWVLFNFDWAPVTGAFWLLAGTLWSTAPPHSWGGGAEGAGGARPGILMVLRPIAALGLVAATIVFAVFPLMADVWYLHGRLDLSVRVDPYQAQYHWSLGDFLIGKGDLPGGVAELRRAADLGETEPGLYLDLGNRELQLGNLAGARRAYQRALQIDPYFTPAAERLSSLGG